MSGQGGYEQGTGGGAMPRRGGADEPAAAARAGPKRGEADCSDGPEYRVRILVEVVLLPDSDRGTKRGDDADDRAVLDACSIKGYLEDPEIQDRIDEAGARGRIIGACVQDVRRVDFGGALPIDTILDRDIKRRLEEAQR